MIFSGADDRANPSTVRRTDSEAIFLHEGLTRSAARTRAIEMLERVGIPAPGQSVDEYPHHLRWNASRS